MTLHLSRSALVLAGLLAAAPLVFADAPVAAHHPALGTVAPEIAAVTLDNKPIHLNDLRGKPVVLEFGSATEPLFRARAKAVEALAKKYEGRVAFIILYAKESHAADSPRAIDLNTDQGFSFAAPTSLTERIALAKQTAGRLHINPAEIAVDQFNDFTSNAYGGYPNMTFIIDAKGVLQAGYAWMDPTRVGQVLDELLVGRPVPPELRGRTKPGGPDTAGEDVMEMSIDMTGRGPQAVGTVLDHLSLTDSQKAVLYPAIAKFYTDLRDIRQLQAGVQNPQANGGAPAQASLPPAVTAEQLQGALEAIRTSARNLDTVCKQTLSDPDYHRLMDPLKQGPQMRRFFETDTPAERLPQGRRGLRGG
ncbi:MAG TPA: deiodinase-like protein [Phycisphaerae bacterium]|nr:deiodinase-like protein [Phycisphaerae bacterium]